MTTTLKKFIFSAVLLTALVPLYVGAATTYTVSDITLTSAVRFTNENWHTLPHPRVATFTIYDDGSSSGTTENGVPFVQYNVPNENGIRVQRFEIQDHYHYIVEGEVVYTITELSSHLARAYQDTSTA